MKKKLLVGVIILLLVVILAVCLKGLEGVDFISMKGDVIIEY